MAEKTVLLEKKEGVATITFNRPTRMNAFSAELGREFLDALEEIAVDETVRVVVLTGAGGHFCSGADMHHLHEGIGAPERLKMMKSLSRIIIAIRRLPQAVVAKVRGVAYGVGVNIALAADFVIAAENARLCEVFVQIGVMMDGGGTYTLPRLVGLVKAREIALLGEEIDGMTADSIGLIYKSVPEEDLDEEVNLLVQKLSKKSLMALALIKEGLETSLDMTLEQALEWEASHQSILLQTKEHKRAVENYLRSRKKL
jgi:2-(1,2-epoxy-1,2-dihydrophenyl)acetyl-CoA isomerase